MTVVEVFADYFLILTVVTCRIFNLNNQVIYH